MTQHALDEVNAALAKQRECEGAQAPSFRPSAQGALRADELIATEYLLRIGDQRCQCGEVYRHHELLLVYTHPQWTATTKFRKLVPVERRTMPDLKVGTSFLQTKHIPLCISCVADVAQPEPRAQCSDRDWAKALADEARERRAAALRAAERRPSADTTPKVNIRKLEF